MATLTALKKAPVLDADTASVLSATTHSVTSSNPAAVRLISDGGGNPWYAVWAGAGVATLTAVRNIDGATATIEVTAGPATPFNISLGSEVPA